jgi:hypothetical protein
VSLAEDDDMIKAFPSDRADQPFSMSVQPWRSRRDWPVTNAHGAKPPFEYCSSVSESYNLSRTGWVDTVTIEEKPKSSMHSFFGNIVQQNGVKKIADFLQPFTKWFFNLLTNAAVVGGLLFAAQNTGNETLKLVAYASCFVLYVYVSSFFLIHRRDLFDWMRSLGLRNFSGIVSILILALVLVSSLSWIFQIIIGIIVNALVSK